MCEIIFVPEFVQQALCFVFFLCRLMPHVIIEHHKSSRSISSKCSTRFELVACLLPSDVFQFDPEKQQFWTYSMRAQPDRDNIDVWRIWHNYYTVFKRFAQWYVPSQIKYGVFRLNYKYLACRRLSMFFHDDECIISLLNWDHMLPESCSIVHPAGSFNLVDIHYTFCQQPIQYVSV